MAILYFSDILKKVGLDPAKVYLLRHSFSRKDFRECYEKDMRTWWTMTPQAWTAAPAAITTSSPALCWGSAATKKCAPAADNSTGANTVNMMARCAGKGEFDMSESKKLNEQIAQDFYNNFKGKLEDEKLDQMVQEIKCTENKYHTQGSLICAVFYFRVTVGGYDDVKKQFTGNGGGGGLPGAQALIGDLYTSDLERLYRDTDSFQFTVTPVYTSVLFFDKSSRLLGHYQAGAVSTPTGGIGGGKGSWE